MKRILKITSLMLIAAIFCFESGCTSKSKTKEVTLNISAAASLKESLDEIKQLYEKEKTNVKLVINYGSSGTLQQQIEQGADIDIFISAAPKQMDALQSKNLILTDTRKDLLQNDIVLIIHKDSSSITGFNDLTSDKIKQIALGEPKSVPAGQYAEEVLTKLGIQDKVKTKAVYGKDVKEVLSWVETGNADAGIVYASDAKASGKVKVSAIAASDSHTPVVYPAAIIKASKNLEASMDFMNFLNSSTANKAFEKYGFKVNVN